eukprot:TRINITY_DN122860_c0_g1_i1.p1 TRINITY_DN122860_c0_g1~~TRINITY_DN122860_c0_g1_i1.p1  ORF type:complete len:677 (-),score=139.04 TRINITY_DN122860_c0_g1_i1:165-2195(-)
MVRIEPEEYVAWQNNLFKVAGLAAVAGMFLMLGLGVAAIVLPHTGEAKEVREIAKPVVLASLGTFLLLLWGLFKERQGLAEKIPTCNWRHVAIVGSIVAFAVPVLHLGFLVGIGCTLLYAFSVMPSLEVRLRRVAVCDAVCSVIFVEVMRRAGGWEWEGASQTAKTMLVAYSLCALFWPLCLALVSVFDLPRIARLSWLFYNAYAAHAGAIVLMSAKIYLDEIFADDGGEAGVGQKGCIRSTILSPLGVILLGFRAANQNGDYSGPPKTGIPQEPCLADDTGAAAVVRRMIKSAGGVEAVVVCVLTSLWLWALITAHIVYPIQFRVAPSDAQQPKRPCFDRFKEWLQRSTMRLSCVGTFLAAGVILGALMNFMVIVPWRESSPDAAQRRLLALEAAASLAPPALVPAFVVELLPSRRSALAGSNVSSVDDGVDALRRQLQTITMPYPTPAPPMDCTPEYNNSSNDSNFSNDTECPNETTPFSETLDYLLGLPGGDMEYVESCVNETWCSANISLPPFGYVPKARCPLTYCKTCIQCWPDCPEPDNEEEAKVSASMIGLTIANTTRWAWVAVPTVQIQATWCELGALAPALFGLLLYITRSYACSLVGEVSEQLNAELSEQRKMEKIKRLKAEGKDIMDVRVKKTREREALVLVRMSPVEPLPDATGAARAGRVFSV